MQGPQEVLHYWLEELNPSDWYRSDAELDGQITEKFGDLWHVAMTGRLNTWLTEARSALAYIILTDQFSRNMFRAQGKAFASDGLALAAAKKSIKCGWDTQIAEPARQFVYMPLMHSECLVDQDRCVRLILTRMPETGDRTIDHARAHREVIRHFGRFPYRNAALGRRSRAEELTYLAAGGYGYTFNTMAQAA